MSRFSCELLTNGEYWLDGPCYTQQKPMTGKQPVFCRWCVIWEQGGGYQMEVKICGCVVKSCYSADCDSC